MDEGDSSRSRSSHGDLARAVGRTIKVLRTDQGLSRRDLARRAEISYSYLTEIENGTKAGSNSTLGPIADALGVQLHELIGAAEARMVEDERPEAARRPDRGRLAPPSVRREFMMRPRYSDPDQRELLRGQRSTVSSLDEVMRELRELTPLLSPEDQQRVLDLVRRLLS